MSAASQDTPSYSVEEVLENFSAMLASMDYAQEIRLLGIGKWHFRRNKTVFKEFKALTIGLWRLCLKRSFPYDGDFIFERFMLELFEKNESDKARERANAFDLLVRSYIDLLGERGDADFTTVSAHMTALLAPRRDSASLRLRLALRIRTIYTMVFSRLI